MILLRFVTFIKILQIIYKFPLFFVKKLDFIKNLLIIYKIIMILLRFCNVGKFFFKESMNSLLMLIFYCFV